MSNPNSLPETVELPLLPLRDVVVFPHMVIPLFVGRPKSIKALEMAMEAGKNILLVAQKSAAKDEPEPEDLYRIGCMANILQMLKLPDGTVKVLVEGTQRARVESIEVQSSVFMATASPLPQAGVEDHEIEAMRRAVVAQFDQFVKLNKKIPPEVLSPPTCRSSSSRSRKCSRWKVSATASIACSRNSSPKSTSSRSKSASAAASSARWKRASASTT